jgi:hypothetical protein
MPIEIDEVSSPDFFRSLHFIAYPLGGGSYTIVRSGVVLLPNESQPEAEAASRQWAPSGFRGTSDWRGDTVSLRLDLNRSVARLHPPPLPAGTYWAFAMDQWAPIASLNSIYNSDVSNNAGSSVNTFGVSQPGLDNSVYLNMGIAVRDSDGYLFRIGFYVTLVGRLVEQTSSAQ